MIQIKIHPLIKPINIKAEILKGLIDNSFITEQDFTYNSFRVRLTEIRRELEQVGITVHFGLQEFVNEYGNKGTFRKHYLHNIDKEKASAVYNKINVR
jgi:hypothetical protein